MASSQETYQAYSPAPGAGTEWNNFNVQHGMIHCPTNDSLNYRLFDLMPLLTQSPLTAVMTTPLVAVLSVAGTCFDTQTRGVTTATRKSLWMKLDHSQN